MTLDSLIRAAVVAACTLVAIPAAASADVFVADPGAFGGSGGIIRVDSTTGARTTVSENSSPAGGPAFVDPLGVVIAPNGDLLVADQSAFPGAGGGVIRVNPVTGQRTTVSENGSPAGGGQPDFVDPFALTLAANGDILVSDQNAFGGPGGVIRVDPVTGARTTVSPSGPPNFDAPFGITTEANGNIVVADATLAALVRVDPATGARTVLSNSSTPPGSPNFDDPYGVARAANGDIIVGDGFAFGQTSGAGLIRTDPLTGARTAITQNSAPAGGPSLVSPTGVAFGSNGEILVADPGAFADNTGGIIRVDPLTGARSTFSANDAPAGGPAFADPWGLAVEPETAQQPPPPPPPPPPGELPLPVRGVSANVQPVSGTVLIALPGAPRTFVPLTDARQIPIGSLLDTRRGSVRLTTSTTGGRTQTGDFSRGLFQLLQSRKQRDKGLTELRLKGSSFARCTLRRGKRATASALSRRTVRRLRGSANGRFRTTGRNSSATVRGTIWTVTDRCDGTLTTVKRGRVAVRDFRRKKTVVVRAGKHYLARAKASR